MKFDRKQDINVLYQVCVFWADLKNKMAALASDWLSHYRLLLWNRGTEYNYTWQETRSQRPLPSLCFSVRSKKQDGCCGVCLADTFLTSSLKPLNGIQWNLTGSKISMSSTKFVLSGRWVNKNCRPGWSVKMLAHCTQVHDMWPFRPLLNSFWTCSLMYKAEISLEWFARHCPYINLIQQTFFQSNRENGIQQNLRGCLLVTLTYDLRPKIFYQVLPVSRAINQLNLRKIG